MIELKNYQRTAVHELKERVVRHLNFGGRRNKIVFKAPTGSGKTVMVSAMMDELQRELKESGECVTSRVAWVWIAPNKLHQQLINDPFTILDLAGGYDVIARISGGGPSGQAGALRLGIARALNQIDEENNRATLKKAGFLSRDARVKERKKAGLKKARKAPQFSKR